MIRLTCVCCGLEQEFEDGEAAYRAGWDAEPYFTGYVSCSLCPAAFIIMGQMYRHEPIHEQWAKNGRPTEFSQETCVMPEDRVSEKSLEQLSEYLKSLGRS